MQNTIKHLTTLEKHELYIKRKFKMLYGSGRPIFNITENNQYIRKYNNSEYYFNTHILTEFYNKNFITYKSKRKCISKL